MGRASRNKQRVRDNAGNIYSKLPNDSLMKVLRNLGDKKLDESLNQVFAMAIAKAQNQTEIDLALAETAIMRQRVSGNYDNVFVTSENIIDFAYSNEIKPQDVPAMVDIIRGFGDASIAFHLINRPYSLFALLTPSAGILNKPAIALSMGDGHKSDGLEREDVGCIGLDDYEARYKSISDFSEEDNKRWRLLFNLILYMDAFPESVKTGPPNIFIEKYQSNGKIKSIDLSDSMREVYARGPVSPHMRRGHFRFLKSEKYKNKRFQTVYVKPSMVKSRASHVTEVA